MKNLLLLVMLAFSFESFGQTKMKPDELVKKHLDSIGSAEDRAAVKSIIAIGNSKVVSQLNSPIDLVGVSQLGSEGNNVLMAHVFNSNNYPYEKAGYNGEKLSIALLPEGKRSLLGDFFRSNDSIFEEGLIGGTLSSAWALLNTDARKPRLSYSGIEKINDRQVHKLKYVPRKGGEMQINLFFDADTFRHVRTEYQLALTPPMGASSVQNASQKERRFKLVEEFSDFKTEGKLTLPHTYKLHFTNVAQNRTLSIGWMTTLTQFVFNQSIGADAFTFDARN